MRPRRIGEDALGRLLSALRAGREAALGTYIFKGLRIQVSRYGASGTDRSARLYRTRRALGLCVRCGVRVARRNTVTGKPYRLCDAHRKSIDMV
jgi:hypothetical protein